VASYLLAHGLSLALFVSIIYLISRLPVTGNWIPD
jgi:hypothetical protein